MLLAASWVGTAPGWLTLAGVAFGLWRLSRGGAGSAVSELSKANEVLTGALHAEREKNDALGGEVRDLREELAEVRGRTDFATALGNALAPVLTWMEGHERRSQERHELTMRTGAKNTAQVVNILELVAKRLGPEPAGDDNGETGAEGVAA